MPEPTSGTGPPGPPPAPAPTPTPAPPPGPGRRFLVDLWPRSERGGELYARDFEAALETIEETGGATFTADAIHESLGRWPHRYRATCAAIEALLALGWITRLTPDGARGKPIQYAITPGCEPVAVAR
jgi:hypothetical protein